MDQIRVSDITSISIQSPIKTNPPTEAPKKDVRKYHVPIPDHCIQHTTPRNFNLWFKEIKPNLDFYLRQQTKSKDMAAEILHDFVVYMLTVAPSLGIPRYQIYNPVRFPNQPYHKWFIKNLMYFKLTYFKKKISDSFLSLVSSAEEAEAPGCVSLEAVQNDKVSDPFSEVLAQSVLDKVRDLSAKYGNILCFEAYAYRLLIARIEGVPNGVIAQDFRISTSGINQWLKKLRNFISELLEESDLVTVAQ